MISVYPIPAELTYDFRSVVFEKPREDCRWPEDRLEGVFHLGGFIGGLQKGACSFAPCEDAGRPGQRAFRLCGLAVLEEARGQGLGGLLLLAGEGRAREMGFSHIWCLARTAAAGFYQKYGWETVGEPSETPYGEVCVKMAKDLSGPYGCGGNTFRRLL